MSVWKPDETRLVFASFISARALDIFLRAITTEMFWSGFRVKYYYPNIFYK